MDIIRFPERLRENTGYPVFPICCRLLFYTFLLFFLSLQHLDAAENSFPKTLVISAIENEQTHAIAEKVLFEAYRRIGYRVVFDYLPAQRALEWANRGITDGDAARIRGTEKNFSNLIPVPTPVMEFQGVAFTKNIIRPINSWEDLRNLKIGVIRGIQYSTIGTRGMQAFFAKDMTHLFKLLDLGRIDVAVAVLEAGQVEISRNFKNSGIHTGGAPLYSAPLYHFLNVRHADIVNKLESALNEMEKQGVIEKIHNKTFDALMNPPDAISES